MILQLSDEQLILCKKDFLANISWLFGTEQQQHSQYSGRFTGAFGNNICLEFKKTVDIITYYNLYANDVF